MAELSQVTLDPMNLYFIVVVPLSLSDALTVGLSEVPLPTTDVVIVGAVPSMVTERALDVSLPWVAVILQTPSASAQLSSAVVSVSSVSQVEPVKPRVYVPALAFNVLVFVTVSELFVAVIERVPVEVVVTIVKDGFLSLVTSSLALLPLSSRTLRSGVCTAAYATDETVTLTAQKSSAAKPMIAILLTRPEIIEETDIYFIN